jgi:hypothetical protein
MDVYAALCTARADGSDPKYLGGEKHAMLAMIHASADDAENAITSLLQSNGWREPAIQQLKLLAEPFHSDDPAMQRCYDSAIHREGGIVIYSDPMPDA